MTSREAHLLERFFLESRLSRIDAVLDSRSSDLIVVLDGVQNHHNISAVLRSADAFGLQKIFLVGESFSYSRGISLGSERWLTIDRFESAEECAGKLEADGWQIVLLQSEELSRKSGKISVEIKDLPFERKLAFVFGNELRGVSEPFSRRGDFFAHIPMVGFVESLNISVAAAITFYTALSCGRPAMEAAERVKLRENWLVKDLRSGEEILARLRLSQAEEELQKK